LIFSVSRLLARLTLAALLSQVFLPFAFAMTRTWDGGGTDAKWTTAANWSGDIAPAAGDTALFDTTSAKDAQIPTAVSINSLILNSGYLGTVTQSGGITLTIGTGSFIQGGGTFKGGTGYTVINGSLTQTGGTFTAPAKNLQVLKNFTRIGGAYSPNHGTLLMKPARAQTLTPGGATLGNVNVNDGMLAYWPFDDTGVGSVSEVSGNRRTARGYGSVTVSADHPTVNFPNAGSFHFPGDNTGASNGCVNANGVPNLTAGNSNDGVFITPNFSASLWVKLDSAISSGTHYGNILSTVYSSNDFYLQAGSSSYRLTVGNNSHGGGTSDTTSLVPDTWTHVGVTYDATQGGLLKLYRNGVLVNSTTGYSGAAGEINVGGFYCNFGFPGYIDDVRIYNRPLTAAEIARLAAGNQPQTSSGSVTLAGSLSLSGSLTLAGGALDVTSSNYGIAASGSWLNYGGVFTPRSGTVTLSGIGAGMQILSGDRSFNNLTLGGAGSWTAGDTLDINGNFLLSSASFTAPSAITLAGNFTNNGIFTANGGTVTLDGSSQTLLGSTTFSSLTKTPAGLDTLFIGAGTVQIVNGTLTLRGPAACTPFALRSTVSGTPWTITAGSTSLQFLDIQDSTATTALSTTGVDYGNNTKWTITPVGCHPNDSGSSSTSDTQGGGGGGGGGGGHARAVTPGASSSSVSSVRTESSLGSPAKLSPGFQKMRDRLASRIADRVKGNPGLVPFFRRLLERFDARLAKRM
jgi:hypothetical protein